MIKNPARYRKMMEHAKFLEENTCRCGLVFGRDGPDSERYGNTDVCKRCMRQELTRKVEIAWDGGEVRRAGMIFEDWNWRQYD